MSESNSIEDVGVFGFGHGDKASKTGPVIQQLHKVSKFTVDFSNGGIEWVTDSRILQEGKTSGENNIACIHAKLDEFIARYIIENKEATNE